MGEGLVGLSSNERGTGEADRGLVDGWWMWILRGMRLWEQGSARDQIWRRSSAGRRGKLRRTVAAFVRSSISGSGEDGEILDNCRTCDRSRFKVEEVILGRWASSLDAGLANGWILFSWLFGMGYAYSLRDCT